MPIPTTGAGTTGTAGTAGTLVLNDIFLDSRTQSDTDAAAFITAASITDPTQVQAVYTLVGGLKGMGLWTMMTAVYPFIGGSAASHAVNLKSPGTFNITWSGTVTHNSNGVTGDGSTGYGNTGINTATSLSATSCHFCVYQRSITNSNTLLGNDTGGSDYNELVIRLSGVARSAIGSNVATTYSNTFSPIIGNFIVSRTSSTRTVFLRNGSVRGVSSAASTSHPSSNMFLLAFNANGTPTSYAASNVAFTSIGSGLTDADAISLSSLVQHVQSMLGRAV